MEELNDKSGGKPPEDSMNAIAREEELSQCAAFNLEDLDGQLGLDSCGD